MENQILTSLQNPVVKEAARLRNRRDRDRRKLMPVEGLSELKKAFYNGAIITQLFICDELVQDEDAGEIIHLAAESEGQIYHVNSGIIEKLSYRENPSGVFAVAKQPDWSLKDFNLSACPLIVIAVGIEKPGNLGSILRCMDAVGGDGVIVCDGCTDLANPNVVRASIGTLFTVQVAQAGSAETIQWLKNNKIHVFSALPDASLDYAEADMRIPCAVAVGTEHSGLRKEWITAANQAVKIDMRGKNDSLNVAITSAILLFEARRQRTQTTIK